MATMELNDETVLAAVNDLHARTSKRVLATSLFGDVTAALREHGSATLDEHCC
jgi:hypothetical protein